MTLLECGLCTAPLICLVFSACHPKSPSGERASAHDIAQINALRDQFVAAINAGDAAELVKVYTDDAILIARRLSGFRRQEAIQEAFQTLFQNHEVRLAMTAQEIQIFGDWAYERGTSSMTSTPKASRSKKVASIWSFSSGCRTDHGRFTGTRIAAMDRFTLPDRWEV